MFAIVEIAGKQFKVAPGDSLEVPKLKDSKEGDTLRLNTVLMTSDKAQLELGKPFLPNVSVQLLVKSHGKGEKIHVFKKQPKKRRQVKQGHRPQHTVVEVTAIK